MPTNEIKGRELQKTVQEILVKMQAFGITFKNIQSGKARGAKAKSKTAAIAKKLAARLKRKVLLPLLPNTLTKWQNLEWAG